ncbi:MAG: STAS domain-containing protein [Limnohabitans sp.]
MSSIRTHMPTPALPQDIHHHNAPACLAALLVQLRSQSAATWWLDASALIEFDSSALAVLLACRRAALSISKDLQLLHMPPKLRQLSDLYGVTELLGDPMGV